MGSFRKPAERLYRRLLALYPGDFRAEYGEEMSLLFRERFHAEPALRLFVDVVLDVFRTAPKEHLAMLMQDLRYAFRMLRKSPGFTAVAAVSLAVGIGGNAAIFGAADALLLRPLPVKRPDGIVSVRGRMDASPLGVDFETTSYPDYRDLRDRSRSFDGLAAHHLVTAALGRDASTLPAVTLGMEVSGNFFQTLGVEPTVGRAFAPEDDAVPGRNAVAVLSFATWQSLFGGDPRVLEQRVRVNGVELAVVGVAPASFTGLDPVVRPAVYVPLAMAGVLRGASGARMLERRDERTLGVKGRLKPGVSVRAAEAELSTIAASLRATYPDTNKGQDVRVRTEMQARIESAPANAALLGLLVLLVALVLLIACANVATLLLSRSGARTKEVAIRLAIGASRARLVRQLLTESVLLALLGGALGLLVAYAGIQFFSAFRIPTDLPIALDVRLDRRVLLFSVAAAFTSVLFFGLAPALRGSRADLVPALKEGDPDAGKRRRLLGRHALVVVQVALAFVLLAAGTSLLRGFGRLSQDDPGFRNRGVLTAAFDPTLLRMPPENVPRLYREILARARALPGVRSAALTGVLPMGNTVDIAAFVPEGYALPERKKNLTSFGDVVDEGYFETFRVPILRGRGFLSTDDATAPKVVVVNQVLAEKYWPGQNPLGKRIHLESADGPLAEVVGVASTHKYLWVGEPPSEYLYRPFAQSDRSRMTLLLETDGRSAALAAPLRRAVRAVSADLPIHEVRTIEDHYFLRAVSVPDMIVRAVGSMGALGLGLALVGLYGLVAFSVSRRTREIGIRMAVGAGRKDILRMVLGQGVRLALAGIAVGLLASAGVLRLLDSAVAGAGGADPTTLLVLPPVLVGVTLLATLLPALRAARVEPIRALRSE